MRVTDTVLRVAVTLSSLTPLVSAWPGFLPNRDAIIARQDDSEETSAAEETGRMTITDPPETDGPRPTDSPETETKTNDDDEDEDDDEPNTTGDLNTAEPITTGTDSDESEETGTKTSDDDDEEETRTSFGITNQPGGVSMITPDPMKVATPLYKIGDNVTWAWNYTSILGTPTAVDVLISCEVASETWTLASNMSYETNLVDFYWDTRKQANNNEKPLLTELFTLIIKDAEADITDLPEPGYFNVFSGFTFGMYHPIDYTPLPDWECPGCNAAVPGLDQRALGLAVTMSLVTFFSFTWYVTGIGLQ